MRFFFFGGGGGLFEKWGEGWFGVRFWDLRWEIEGWGIWVWVWGGECFLFGWEWRV